MNSKNKNKIKIKSDKQKSLNLYIYIDKEIHAFVISIYNIATKTIVHMFYSYIFFNFLFHILYI